MPTLLQIISDTISSEFGWGHAGSPTTCTLIHSFGCGKDCLGCSTAGTRVYLFFRPPQRTWVN